MAMPEELLRDIHAFDWTSLSGAYGASDVGPHDVLGALEVLLTEHDVEGDAWLDAINVLQSHATHQGSVYEVERRDRDVPSLPL